MNFFDAVVSAFKNYFNISGRASRSEFWWFFLFCILLYMLTFSFEIEEFSTVLTTDEIRNNDQTKLVELFFQSWFGVSILLTLIPSITVAVRRFHDLGMSGWWYVALQVVPSFLPSFFIFNLISVIALFLFIYFMSQEGVDNSLNTKDH